MKKYQYAILLLTGVLNLAGCSNSAAPLEDKVTSESTTISETTESMTPAVSKTETETTLESRTAEEAVSLQGYLFEVNGVSIGIYEEAKPVLEALGEADSYFETPSCAFVGMDRQYTYGSYMLTTYEEDGQEYIYDIYFLDDKISTPEGIRIGSTLEEVIAAYGEDYTEDFGMYTYRKERSKLQFLVVDEVVTSVDYTTY
ncbi:MAG: hypothetical protein OSJ62_16110 [Lachnospiraceae bacterium]|nr:hypothetical protein [Lachnospiraceae bacterium]